MPDKSPGFRFIPSEEWLKIEGLLHSEDAFLKMVEIAEGTELTPAVTLRTVDHMYSLGAILKQFTINEVSVILGSDEALIPEVGFSQKLSSLFTATGLVEIDFEALEVRYGLNHTSGDFPNPASPISSIPAEF